MGNMPRTPAVNCFRAADGNSLTIIAPHGTITLGAAEVVALWAQLTDVHVPMMTHPELMVDADTQRTICPHCGYAATFELDAVQEVDAAVRFNDGGFRAVDDGETVLDIAQADSEFHTLHHRCAACERPVSIPAGVDTVWS